MDDVAWNSKQERNALCIQMVNIFSILSGIVLVCLAVRMSTSKDDCLKHLIPLLIGIGVPLILISIIGFLGVTMFNPILLWIYLIILGFTFIGLLVFTVTGLIVSNQDPGHHVAGLRYKEYRLQDCSSWFIKMLNDTNRWKYYKRCSMGLRDCGRLAIYRTPEQFKDLKLEPMAAGCCRPPSECGYPAINASYYDLNFEPISSNKDCKIYNNSEAIKCFDCDSCKAGVAQDMGKMWRLSLLDSTVLLVILLPLIKCVYSVKEKAESTRLKRAHVHAHEMLQGRI